LDYFAGSGSFGEAAYRNGRDCVLIDNNETAIEVMAKRLAFANPLFYGMEPPVSKSLPPVGSKTASGIRSAQA